MEKGSIEDFELLGLVHLSLPAFVEFEGTENEHVKNHLKEVVY